MQQCIHCGQDCGKSPVIKADKAFCCEGCAMVYSILQQKQMGQYYEIMSTPVSRLNMRKWEAGMHILIIRKSWKNYCYSPMVALAR
ncbi:MAG: heavy metal translocating P-type ATPase metal-binding domain-containing protein [Bacteroidales bacterium]|nr:heavy metal translocating P-type ATPase metal-binding domain-containing protein [Bacteroidales bacterium]